MAQITVWWLSIPAFARDFIEGLLSAAIGGAGAAVLGLNLDTATPRSVATYALVGAISAAIAYARHKLADSLPHPPAVVAVTTLTTEDKPIAP